MLPNHERWWRGKNIPFMYWLEEGITDRRARNSVAAIAKDMGASDDLVEKIKMRGSYVREVRTIDVLEKLSPGAADRIWEKTTPHDRTNEAAKIVEPEVRRLLKEGGGSDAAINELLKKAGNSIWGYSAHLEYRTTLENYIQDALEYEEDEKVPPDLAFRRQKRYIEHVTDYWRVKRVNQRRD